MANATPAPTSHSTTPVVVNAVAPEQHQEAIDAEVDRLQQWSADDDPASLSNILADLYSPDKEVQDAAIEAAKQFGSTNAIPALKAAAEATDNLQQKIAFLQAADFLSLPSMDFIDPSTIPPPSPEQIQMAQQNNSQNNNNGGPMSHRQRHVPNLGSAYPPDQGAPQNPAGN